jgi:hypothetical protein
MRIKHKHTIILWSVCLSLLSLYACTDATDPDHTVPSDGQRLFTFSVASGDASVIPTRSLTANDEKNIQSVDLLLFRADNTSRVFYQSVIATLADASTHTFRAAIPVDDYQNYDVDILVNAHTLIHDAQLSVGEEKQTALNRLTRTLSAGTKWTDTAIPAWGELTNQSFDQALTLTGENAIPVIRMTARIDLKLSAAAAGASHANFALHTVRLYNYSTRGTLAPHLTGSGLEGTPGHTVTAPTQPSDGYARATYNKGADNSAGGALLFDANDDTAGYLPDSLIRTIYTFETPAGISTQAATNTCLVIGGSYLQSATDTYYRIDLKSDATTYLPLLRNHRYLVNITAVGAPGQPTPDDAFSAVSTVITADVLQWNEGGTTHITIDGSQYLSIKEKRLGLPYLFRSNSLMGDTTQLTLRTNSSAWTARACDDAAGTSASTWLTLAYNGTTAGTVSGTATGTPTDPAATILPVATDNDTDTPRTAYLLITAGRLSYTVPVTQYTYVMPHPGQLAYSNVVLIDGQLTFATTLEETAVIPQESQGIFFQWGSLVGLDPSKSFDAASSVVYMPAGYTGTAITNWASVPHEPGTASLKSYNQYTGVGDVCLYITDQGYVKGKWRMPTIDEWEEIAPTNPVHYGSYAAETGNRSDGLYQIQSSMLVYNDEALFTHQSPMSTLLPASGYIQCDEGELMHVGEGGDVWSASKDYTDQYASYAAVHLFFTKTGEESKPDNRAHAFPIRCIAFDGSGTISVSDALSGNQGGIYTPVDDAHGTLAYTAAGGSHDFLIGNYHSTWNATISSGATWLHLSKTAGEGGNTITVTADAVGSPQTGTVTLTSAAESFTLTVTAGQ